MQPDLKQETLFSAGSNRGQYESFLTLGFGGSGKDLESNWTVSCQGMESIDGTQTAKLDLKPKQPSVANMFSHVTVWIDPTRSLSLKQIFYQPSGDNRTATYTGIKYNDENLGGYVQAEGQGLQRRQEVGATLFAGVREAQDAPARIQSIGKTSMVYLASGASMVASSRLRNTQ